jgi:hypothetical protein
MRAALVHCSKSTPSGSSPHIRHSPGWQASSVSDASAVAVHGQRCRAPRRPEPASAMSVRAGRLQIDDPAKPPMRPRLPLVHGEIGKMGITLGARMARQETTRRLGWCAPPSVNHPARVEAPCRRDQHAGPRNLLEIAGVQRQAQIRNGRTAGLGCEKMERGVWTQSRGRAWPAPLERVRMRRREAAAGSPDAGSPDWAARAAGDGSAGIGNPPLSCFYCRVGALGSTIRPNPAQLPQFAHGRAIKRLLHG